jgi:hypothetical protein
MEKKVILYALAGTATCVILYLAIKKLQENKNKKARKKVNASARRNILRRGDYYGEYTL